MITSGRQQQGFSRLFRWRFFFIINAVLILLLGFTLGREFFRARIIQKEIDALQAQADRLATRNSSLTELQTAIQTQSFIEREARLKLGMKKPGEEVVIIQEKKNPSADYSFSPVDSSDPLGLVLADEGSSLQISNPTKWWYYFFNYSFFKTISYYDEN